MVIKYLVTGIVVILLAAGCGSGTASDSGLPAGTSAVSAKKSVAETDATDWYVNLVAEDQARGLISQSAQLGMLEAGDDPAKESLKALAPFSGNYLNIVFTDPDGLAAGSYKSVFHVYQSDAAQSWRFTVKTDDSHASVIVTWRGLYVLTPYVDNTGRTRYKEYRSLSNPLLKKMQVVDETTGEVLPVVTGDAMTAFVVNMNGATSRTFRWELLPQDTQVTATAAQSAKVVETAQPRVRTTLLSTKPAFDLDKPPVFDERK